MKYKAGKWLRTVAVILASVTVLGALGSLIAFRPERPDSGVIKSDNETVTPGYGYRAEDYASLYVQDGLTACYLAYQTTRDSITADGADLTWHNQVAYGAPATLYGANYWTAMRGGIGYNMTEAQWQADKNNVGVTIPYDLSTVASPDYNVECVMTYLGVTNADGTPYIASSDTYKNGLYNSAKSAFRFDLLCATSFVSRHATNTQCNLKNRWWLTYQKYRDHNGEGDGVRSLVWENVPYNMLGNVVLFTTYRDSILDNFYLDHKMRYGRLDNKVYSASNVIYGGDVDALKSYGYTDEAPRFSLFNGYPGVIYALRYYNRVIFDYEEKQNYFVDLLGFYGVNVSALLRMDEAARIELLRTCADIAVEEQIEFDFENMEANKDKLLQIIDENW